MSSTISEERRKGEREGRREGGREERKCLYLLHQSFLLNHIFPTALGKEVTAEMQRDRQIANAQLFPSSGLNRLG